ncbi:MAG: ester cyclase [Candidatus Thorarchaeota archaeon]
MSKSGIHEIATSFLKLVIAGKVREAYDKYVSQELVHHNPYFEGTRNVLLEAMELDSRKHPHKSMDIKMIIEEGDLVATYSHIKHTPEALGFATVHIFRIDRGKIIEMWDIVHILEEDSPNENGMF